MAEPKTTDAAPDEKAEGGILCPVRGGKKSARTVERAFALAEQSGQRLVFLYVVDVDFLGFATVARVRLMAEELMETGRFALSILADKARARGIEQIEEITREGKIQTVITQVAAEFDTRVLVIGRPVRTPGIPSFAAPDFEKMLAELAETTGMRIDCVE